MGREKLFGALCFMCAAIFSTSSWAATTATVNPSQGNVLINRGKGFSEIKRPTKLRVGNSVMVGPGGSAVIAYSDGCTVNVDPGTIKTVAQLSPCASGSSAATDPSYSQNNSQYVFWAAWAAGVGFITYEIVAISP
jgi:hypothetical protein